MFGLVSPSISVHADPALAPPCPPASPPWDSASHAIRPFIRFASDSSRGGRFGQHAVVSVGVTAARSSGSWGIKSGVARGRRLDVKYYFDPLLVLYTLVRP